MNASAATTKIKAAAEAAFTSSAFTLVSLEAGIAGFADGTTPGLPV
ncbi:hypothetical protein [Arthrobacter sp. UNC362MFTsu5.1]|nr:hypothetical protein [Arthrobacter sp. UNC362MFTsu5.1]